MRDPITCKREGGEIVVRIPDGSPRVLIAVEGVSGVWPAGWIAAGGVTDGIRAGVLYPPSAARPLTVTIDAGDITAVVAAVMKEICGRSEASPSAEQEGRSGVDPIGVDALGMPIFAATPAAESETDRRVRELFDASDSALRADRFAASRGGKAPPSMHEAPPQSPDAPQSPAVGGAGR